jgi:hypothetical protein
MGPVLGFFMGGGPLRRAPERVGYPDLGSKHLREEEAARQSSAYAGVVHGGQAPPGKTREVEIRTTAMGRDMYESLGTQQWSRGAGGKFTNSYMSRMFGRGMEDYFSPDTARSRFRGEDQGPMLLLKEFQGSNRGSGNYQPAIPRYSIAETRKSINKFAPENFVRLNKHPGYKYLEPGTEVMMKRQKNYLGGARKVTRKFL